MPERIALYMSHQDLKEQKKKKKFKHVDAPDPYTPVQTGGPGWPAK